MRELPIEHTGQVAVFGQKIAQTVVPVIEHRCDRIGQIVHQPAQTQRDDRPVAAGLLELGPQIGNPLRVIECGHSLGQVIGADGMDPGQIAACLLQQGQRLLHRQNCPRIGRAGQGAHDKTAAKPVILCKHGQHFGRGYASAAGSCDDGGLFVMPERAVDHEIHARRAAQDIG